MHRYVESGLPNPAAAADWSWTPNTGERFRLVSLYGVLTTSATVANRQPVLSIVDRSGNTLFAKSVISPQTATTAVKYSWATGDGFAAAGSAVVNGVVSDGVPDNWWPEGYTVKVTTTGLSAGDQWSNLFMAAESFDRAEYLATMRAIEDLSWW